MPMRKKLLVVGGIYHVFNKSIAGFKIFNNKFEFSRLMDLIRYYQREKPPTKFSKFIRSNHVPLRERDMVKEKLVEIISYCLMPTHFHLILKQLKENGISNFMRYILNSYTHYFNTKHDRKGPLWVGRFKSVLVETDEQLLHLTRYIHLNPVTAYLVDYPEKWPASSYQEYLLTENDNTKICNYDGILDIEPISYRKFVEDMTSYQREMAKIKELLIE